MKEKGETKSPPEWVSGCSFFCVSCPLAFVQKEQKVFLVFSFIFQLNASPAPPQGNQMGQDETTVRQAAEGVTRKEHPLPSVFFI